MCNSQTEGKGTVQHREPGNKVLDSWTWTCGGYPSLSGTNQQWHQAPLLNCTNTNIRSLTSYPVTRQKPQKNTPHCISVRITAAGKKTKKTKTENKESNLNCMILVFPLQQPEEQRSLENFKRTERIVSLWLQYHLSPSETCSGC